MKARGAFAIALLASLLGCPGTEYEDVRVFARMPRRDPYGRRRADTARTEAARSTIAEHPQYTPLEKRLVFVEKVRHGVFFGCEGTMPPFSREVLSDADMGDLLAYLAVY